MVDRMVLLKENYLVVQLVHLMVETMAALMAVQLDRMMVDLMVVMSGSL